MKPTPPGWPRAASSLNYERASEAIDWLCRAFDFEVRLKVEGEEGKIEHSELTFGGALFMVGDAKPERMPERAAPSEVGGKNTQSIMVYVDDIEAHFARAVASGAKITAKIETHDYGEEYWTDRSYGCQDIGGHQWWFSERVRTSPKQG